MNGLDIKFSIGIPAFKAKYLRETIDSVLSQTYFNFELIIINDYSPDNIEDIISDYNDTRIIYSVNHHNLGSISVVENWNKCLQKATGNFFLLLGDDDVLKSNYLFEFHKLIIKYPSLSVFHCRSLLIDEESIPFYVTPSWPEYETVYENIWHRVNGLRIQFVSDFVYRTNYLKANGGFVDNPLAWFSDDLTAYKICFESGIAHTNEILFKYRKNRHSITTSGNPQLKFEAIELTKLRILSIISKPTTSPDDEFFRNRIIENLSKYYNKQKISVIVSAFEISFIKYFFLAIFKKNKWKITYFEILNAILLFVFNRYKQLKVK